MTFLEIAVAVLILLTLVLLFVPAVRRWLGVRLAALKPCRFSILLVLAGIVFLVKVPQGQDVLRALAEHERGNSDDWTRFFFFTAALLWSVSGWYWAQAALKLKLDLQIAPEQAAILQRFRVWLPRIIGTAAAFGLAGAFALAASGYDNGTHLEVRAALNRYAVWCLIGGIVFLIATIARRPLARALHTRLRDKPAMQGRLGAPVLAMLDLPREQDIVYGATAFGSLPPLTRWLLFAMILLAVALFFLFVFAVQTVAPVLGAAAILLFAASGWIAVGSSLDALGQHFRFPVFTLLLGLVIGFSLWNDNHKVHVLKDESPDAWVDRQDVRDALRQWLAKQQDRPARSAGAKIPMYVVNAEGGGIRAAYWTATVLGTIQQDNACFADHLFSLSGVSGGSLGVAVFNALLADARNNDNGFRCDRHGQPVTDTAELLPRAQKILDHDFFSPVMAGMLYPDLAQRFWFRPMSFADRGRMLEEAFEKAWFDVTKNKRFAEPIDKLWRDRDRMWMPALFLNATWVETGKRLITSNLRLQPRGKCCPGDKDDFVDTEDTHRFFGDRALALSTAVHLSARFSYVSPAGTLVDTEGKVQGRAVDGGYFENSGATTTLEILKAMDQLAAKDPTWKRVEVTVIHISNEPVKPKHPDTHLDKAASNPATEPLPMLNEVLSPPLALVNTRGARGVFARDTLAWHVSHANFLHFGLCEEKSGLPLGWVLSKATQDEMDKQLTRETCTAKNEDGSIRELFNNPRQLCEIRRQLAMRFAAPGAQQLETCD